MISDCRTDAAAIRRLLVATIRYLVTDVDGGAGYEIRVIYASGKGTVTYSLSVMYPN